MWTQITWLILLCGLAAEIICALALRHGKEGKFLLAGNPRMPNGNLRYDMKKFRKSIERMIWAYVIVTALLAIVLPLTKMISVLPDWVLTVSLYLFGAVVVLAFVAHLVYMDNFGQQPLHSDTDLL